MSGPRWSERDPIDWAYRTQRRSPVIARTGNWPHPRGRDTRSSICITTSAPTRASIVKIRFSSANGNGSASDHRDRKADPD